MREALRNPDYVLSSLRSNASETNYQYERLYRNLYNPQFFYRAYQNIYAGPGNMTAGTDGKTIDGMSFARIDRLIASLKDYSYQPHPARRTYIQKKNGKQRPLGIPSFEDKLVQEVVRMILESIYEPTFSNRSHGFRPNRSCHTALLQIQKEFTGTKYFIEGDIKGFFDNIDHHVMVAILRKRIRDEAFLALIWKFLRAGFLEDWVYHDTYSGTPQGSIISPILSNIYLNEFDRYMERYIEQFRAGDNKRRKRNAEYWKCEQKLKYLRYEVCAPERWAKYTQEEKRALQTQIAALRREMMSHPYSDPMDSGYRRLFYVRYADDWLCGVIGSKADAERIKADVKAFLWEQLRLELSDEKTLITHARKGKARFLSYDVFVSNDESLKKGNSAHTKRAHSGKVRLYVPREKWQGKLMQYQALKINYVNGKEVFEPVHRTYLISNDDLEILRQYNAEIRGIYNYYRIANNVSVLCSFFYVMKFSLFKTLAAKYRTSIHKIRRKYGCQKFGVPYETKRGTKICYLYDEGFRRRKDGISEPMMDMVPKIYRNNNPVGLIARLKARRCEYCGAEDVPLEIHHVRKLKDLKGREPWERLMIGRRRKTLALCAPCHDLLHAGKLNKR